MLWLLWAAACKPGDAFYLSFLRDRELSDTAFVEPDTSVFLPLVGQLSLAGLTKSEAAKLIQDTLSKFYALPLVKVYPMNRVYISGNVAKPGVYYALPTDDFLKLVAAAGPKDRADLARVKVVRAGKVIGVDLRRPVKLMPADGDVVIVPRCWWPTLQQIYYALAAVAVLISLGVSLGGGG